MTRAAMNLEDSVLGDVAPFEHTREASFPLVLWVDESAPVGWTFTYRIRAANLAGQTDVSTVVEMAR